MRWKLPCLCPGPGGGWCMPGVGRRGERKKFVCILSFVCGIGPKISVNSRWSVHPRAFWTKIPGELIQGVAEGPKFLLTLLLELHLPLRQVGICFPKSLRMFLDGGRGRGGGRGREGAYYTSKCES